VKQASVCLRPRLLRRGRGLSHGARLQPAQDERSSRIKLRDVRILRSVDQWGAPRLPAPPRAGAPLAGPVGMHLDPPADLQAHRFSPTPTDAGIWSDLEQAFFASAPPEEPESPPEPSSCDDLREPPAPRRSPVATTATRGPRRIIAVIVAAVASLIGFGLSAAVLAAR
jgi:hypothetical protein